MEVYNFDLHFSGNVIQNGCISLSFLAACLNTHHFPRLAPSKEVLIETSLLRATYFPGTTKPILAAIVLLEHVPLKVLFCFLNL